MAEKNSVVHFKRVLNKVFNRLTALVLVFMIQALWMVIAILKLGAYSEYTTLIFTILAGVMSLFVIYRDDNAAYRIGWILIIGLLPIFGTLLYVFYGNKRPSKRLAAKVETVSKEHRTDLMQKESLRELSNTRMQRTLDYVARKGPYPAWSGTRTKYYDMADKAFVDLMEDVKRAEHYIFIEYFIIGTGEMWGELFTVLKQKVKAGVDVRIIYDDVGSVDKLPLGFPAMLEEAGIKVVVFNPVRPILSLVYNNRDHRKIVVIDGYIGYSGGFNISDEYINKVNLFGRWKDSGIRLEGRAVWNYTVMFLNMWNAYKPTEKDYSPYRPEIYHPDTFDSDGIIQPFSDTPLDNENLSENIYMEIINQAEEYVYIFTPYLILDDEMMGSLRLAAKRGVDVRIVTPGIPDKKLIFRLTRSYYTPLIKAGVKIYEYTPGFLHAKNIVSDGMIGVVGTINLDYRSLYLHFECGTLMIGSRVVRDIKEDFARTFAESKRIHTVDIRKGFFGTLFDGILRAMSPLL